MKLIAQYTVQEFTQWNNSLGLLSIIQLLDVDLRCYKYKK